MLQIIGILYISGWVLGLVALIMILVKYKKKMKNINQLYDYERYIGYINRLVTIKANSIDNRKIIDNKEEKRLEIWETRPDKKDIWLSSVYYVETPEDITEEVSVSSVRAGCGGIGWAWNPMQQSNPYVINSINQYYYPQFAQTSYTDEKCTQYAFKVMVRVIFISKEVDREFLDNKRPELYNSYVYIVNQYNPFYDDVYRINRDGFIDNRGCSTDYLRNEILYSIPRDELNNIIESKRKSNYRLFKHLNLYLRNGDE